ncbi:MAG: FG-GAP repeat domain-containing protein [Acidimicrobiia bacterium]
MNRSAAMSRTLLSACLLLALLPTTPSTANAYPANAFDGNDWSDGLVDFRPGDNRNTELVSSGMTDSGLEVTIPEGSFRGLGPLDRIQGDVEEAWYRYHVQLLDFHARSTGKLPGLSGLYSETGRGCKPSRPGSPGWSARGLFGAEGSNGAPDGEIPIGFYLYHLYQPDLCGEPVFWDGSSLRPGRWHCIEGYVRLNTLGKRDGLVMGWLDGSERFSRDRMAFRRPNEPGVSIRELWLDIYYGGKRPTANRLNLMIDEVEVSTKGRIGCLDRATSVVGSFGDHADAIATYDPNSGSLMMNQSAGSAFERVPLTTFRPGDNWSTHLIGDFSGDGREAIASYHPSNGSWWVSARSHSGFTTTHWGTFTTRDGWGTHLVGDFTGDGIDEIASYHPTNGSWWLSRPTTGRPEGETEVQFASAFDNGSGTVTVDQILRESSAFPVLANDRFKTSYWGAYTTTHGWSDQLVGDFNGDGKDDIASYFPASGAWWVNLSNGAGFTAHRWARFAPGIGWSNHLTGDFNGDGRDDIASYHSSNGTWWVSLSTGDSFDTALWETFTPATGWRTQIAGDFDGDGRTDIASFHSGNGTWWVSVSEGSGFSTTLWDTYKPAAGWTTQVSGDFNGDGLADVANYHVANGTWWVGLSTGSAFVTSAWGKD